MPFLAFTKSQIAGSHLSRPMGESSKIVPSFTLNCFPHPLHFQMRRVERNECSADSQRGQTGPLGQRSATTKSSETSGLAKYLIACANVVGAATVFVMDPNLVIGGR